MTFFNVWPLSSTSERGNALVNGATHINMVYEYQGECAFRYTSRDLYMRKPASEETNA